jgi:hypothetical protein
MLVLKKANHSALWSVHGRPGEVRLGVVEATHYRSGQVLRVEVIGEVQEGLAADGETCAHAHVADPPVFEAQVASIGQRLTALEQRGGNEPAIAAMVAQVRARVAAGLTQSEARRLIAALDAALGARRATGAGRAA